ncbi:Ig-like domain-containing protein [Edaphobacter aggregans]|uniref:Ig-like domain-containing protein n=1 Tax=Edaphobacter aggregans TaxID=570835 RepID=A0A3R9QD14_9BACT|nr:Ig-like domain-containing protein [Edaphobacter aggregans]
MHSRLFPRFALSALVLFAVSVLPARAGVQNRINAPVSSSNRVAVQHTISPRALRAQDLGSAPADRKLESITLHFNMTAAQQADLNQLLIDQQNPSSPSYHQWLTPAQFGARFGLSSSDLSKVTSWLTSKGLTIASVAPSSNYVSVSGTVGQVEQAFGVSMHAMSENGQQHIANVTDPQLPAAIANIVTGITGLHDFKLKSRARVATPRYTSSVTGSHYIAPGDFYTIYDVNQLISGNSINGSGISIAIVGQTDISTAAVSAFRSASGLSSNLPTIVKATGYVAGIVSADVDEAQLDVEWSGAVAPNATILFVTVGSSPTASVMDALNYAISNNLAPIVSISYGNCESGWGQSELNSINQELQQANAQGITVVGPSGDSGATDCDIDPPADFGLAVDFPASSPFATSAGGSMFNEGSATGTTSYWNSNSSSSTSNAGSALSYIPETVWNESNSTGFGAGGGGVSAYFSKPAWQVGTGVPSDSSRDVPDVSFNAASGHDGYLFCSVATSAASLTPCTNGFRDSSSNLDVVGGTSVAAPTLAGVFALLEQQLGGGTANRIGNANPMIYGLANSTYYNNVFHDITSGNNNSTCQQGTTNCPSGGSIGYNAAPGYDLATGWGSLDVYNFVNKWKLVTPTGSGVATGSAISSTTVTTSAATCSNSSGSLALTIAVANASGTSLTAPTGTVQILVDNVALTGTNTATLSGGSATFTVNTSTLSSGGHTFGAVYLGDGNYAASKGSLYADIVSSSQKDFALTPCTAPSSTASGSSASGITFTITPANGFTGTVNLTANVDNSVAASYTFSPATVTISSGAVTSTLVLTADQSSTSGTFLNAQNSHPASHIAPWYIAGSGASLACMMLLVLPRRRRWGALLALLLSVAAISASGCGGSSSSSSSSGSGGTTPSTTFAARGTYTVNVTAISGSLVHTSTVTFTVQ